MADAFRKNAFGSNQKPADLKFSPSTYDDVIEDDDEQNANEAPRNPPVSITRAVTRFDPDTQADVTFYVTEFNLPLINERIRFMTHGNRRLPNDPNRNKSDPNGSSSSSDNSDSSSPPKDAVAQPQIDDVQVEFLVCFIRYSHFEWFHEALVDMFPDAPIPEFPPKSYNLFRDNSPEYVEKRRSSLDAYMNQLLSVCPSVMGSPPFATLTKLR